MLGVAIIGAAIFVPGAAPALTTSGFISGTAGASFLVTAAANIGLYLALSGISQMISPTEDVGADSDDPSSFTFNGVQNTIRAGVAIPVVYGEIFTGSLVVSGGIDTDDYSG